MSNLEGGEYDGLLRRAYPGKRLSQIKTRINGAINQFLTVFNCSEDTEISIFSAPGRTELGGNHTDHQNGRVLAAAVDMDILACAKPNGTGIIRINSEGFGDIEVNLADIEPRHREKNTAAALVRGIGAMCLKAGCRVEGFDAYLTSDLPVGAGLSSSAAFEILIGVIINSFFNEGNITAEEIAKAGQYAENTYFGKPCGLMDQLVSAVGGIAAIDFYDADNIKMNRLDFSFESKGYELCIVNTGSSHEDLSHEYAAIPYEMEMVASYFDKKLLSQVSREAFFQALPELRKSCGDRAVLRAFHFFGDTARVEAKVKALLEEDIDSFLELVCESGHSSCMYLQNVLMPGSSRHQNMAVALATADYLLGGKGACRVHGGGFAGAIQAYVASDILESFISGMERIFGKGACVKLNIRYLGGLNLLEQEDI
jgi:galactokinase